MFFSRNGLYYPDTVESFVNIIIENDRFEWQNVMKSSLVQVTYEMVILVRDVYKTFYQKGINSSLDSIEKVLYFLKEKTEGYQVITCGQSAGDQL